ncbi:polysaccharide pyruvyl transferase CsaB [Candidatus Formimonas warabiya]|uniref:Polysaccharide pyruvyl transferase CsaB n=1 Tax=Formimonas warabiya TaxID=1761012 RepID=A0A3G1KTW1_FORW1|nr:polysaccharide pyruvyl transferase CsaB [Candidatus Formimonas warabiya]ATW25943.1 polysaccharide pyruvyl transferase CsaB [Candidatus Formimonas warabiya]
MKNIVLSGYYGFNNIGDEAVLASVIQALRDEMPDVQITVLSNDPQQTEKQYSVQAVNRWRVAQIIPALRRCNLLISGGGSLLQDVTGPKSILYYLGVIQLAHWFGKPVMIYAQGIGPVKRSWARKLMARVLNRVRAISVRDQASKADLEAMGVSRPPIAVTVDPVIGWARPGDRHFPDSLHPLNSDERKCVGVSLRHWDGLNEKEMAAVCDFIGEKGYRVIFLPFHFPGDISVCRKVANLMKGESFLVKDNFSPGEMMDAVGSMHLIIGMRLHALIMAGAQGVPFVAVSYDPKVERFAELMGQAAACSVETLSCADLKRVVEQILGDYSLIKQDLLQKTEVLKIKARENAKIAAQLIHQGNCQLS